MNYFNLASIVPRSAVYAENEVLPSTSTKNTSIRKSTLKKIENRKILEKFDAKTTSLVVVEVKKYL